MKWPFFRPAKPEPAPKPQAPAAFGTKTSLNARPGIPVPTKPALGTATRSVSPAPLSSGARAGFADSPRLVPAVPRAIASKPAPVAAEPAKPKPAGKTVAIGLQSIASQFPAPMFVPGALGRTGGISLAVPFDLVGPQLATGKVRVSLDDLVPLIPADLLKSPLPIDATTFSIALPIAEIVANVPADDLRIQDQGAAEPTEQLADFPDLISDESIAQRRSAAAPAAAAAAVAPSGPAAPALPPGVPREVKVSLGSLLAGVPDTFLACPRTELAQHARLTDRVPLPVAPMLPMLQSAKIRLPLTLVLKALPASVLAQPLPEPNGDLVAVPLHEIISQLPPTVFALAGAAAEPLISEDEAGIELPFHERSPAATVATEPAPAVAEPEPEPATVATGAVVEAAAPEALEMADIFSEKQPALPPAAPAPAAPAPKQHDTQPMRAVFNKDEVPPMRVFDHDSAPDETQLIQMLPPDDEIPTPFNEKQAALAAPVEPEEIPTVFVEKTPAPPLAESVAVEEPAPAPAPEPVTELPVAASGPTPVVEPAATDVSAAASVEAAEPLLQAPSDVEGAPAAAEAPCTPEPVIEPAPEVVAELPAAVEPTVPPTETGWEVTAESAAPAAVAPVELPAPVPVATEPPALAAELPAEVADVDGDDLDLDDVTPAAAPRAETEALAAAPAPDVPPFDEKQFLANLNRASVQDLQTVSGVGPALARRIIEYRNTHGQFYTVRELRRVPGIGYKIYQALTGLQHRALNRLLDVDHDNELSLQEIMRLIAALKGVEGCTLTADDGLFLTGSLPAHLDQNNISVFAPQLFKKVGRYARELRVGQVRRVTLFTDLHPVSIFQADDIYLIIVHDTRHYSKALLRRLTRISEEIARHCRQRAAA